MKYNEVTAVIVARGGSVRIPSKSLLVLEGESLIERKIHQLQNCKKINRIVFGSDNQEMLEVAKKAGAEIVKRPDFYCDEKQASANDMIANMMDLMKTDVVVWAHCTNPLLSAQTYDNAVGKFLELYPKYDSLLSVVELREHLWSEEKHPLNYNPYGPRHVPARDLPPYYMQDGGIFIQPYQQMKANSYFFGKKPYLFQIPNEEFLDINERKDYLLAKAILEDRAR
ncbi:MAG: acylneuraminate cytidylyltransferase family protein [Alphaproteobacteria bacterium]|nr:acylneuraminate cytidylyltransferase family protein [Alphaproteobacteria bacterium]